LTERSVDDRAMWAMDFKGQLLAERLM